MKRPTILMLKECKYAVNHAAVGRAVAKWREAHGVSQLDVAMRLPKQATAQYISGLERAGDTGKAWTRAKLDAVLGAIELAVKAKNKIK
jgi:transcriptional regulator with XRE-family HTH domain